MIFLRKDRGGMISGMSNGHGSKDVRFARIELAIGTKNLQKLKRSRVTVIGLGAVGGFACEGLIRSGIGALRIIDIDSVQYTNFNRQIVALESTVGLKKVEAAYRRLHEINPSAEIEPVCEFFHRDTADSLLGNQPDYVIDAIDATLPKIELLYYCHIHGIPVISSMGAAFKKSYDKIKIADFSETTTCPLAKTIRRGLYRRGIKSGIPVIFSDEEGPPFIEPELVTDPELGTATHRGRPRRILGSMCPMAAIFGMLAAHHVIWALLNR